MSIQDDILKALDEIKIELQDAIARQTLSPKQIVIASGLSDISERLGLMRAGEFRSGNDAEPGKGFSGVRIGYPPFWYNGRWFNIVGISNDSLQFGLSADNGVGYFAAGLGILDADALKFTGLLYGIQHTATAGGISRIGKLGMFVPTGASAPSYRIGYEATSGTELVSNGGAETGDETGWTDSDTAWAVSTLYSIAGAYSFRHDPTDETCPATLVQSVASLSALTNYTFSFASRLKTGSFAPYVQLAWKNGGGTTIRTDQIEGTLSDAWVTATETFKSPSGTASVTITIYPGDPFSEAYIDAVSLYATSLTVSLYFAPDLTLTGANMAVPDGNVYSGDSDSMADDSAISFTPGKTNSFMLVYAVGSEGTTYGLVLFNTDTPTVTSISAGSALAVTTGVLAGTTGTDTKLTISAHTDGKVYIENRLGSTKTVKYTLIGG